MKPFAVDVGPHEMFARVRLTHEDGRTETFYTSLTREQLRELEGEGMPLTDAMRLWLAQGEPS